MKKKSVRLLRAQAERRAELLELKGPIVYYVPEGGVGFQKSVVFQNFTKTKENAVISCLFYSSIVLSVRYSVNGKKGKTVTP